MTKDNEILEFGRMATRGRPVSSTKTRKVAQKLQERIRNGEYYEAHQTYRVLYQRYRAQGKQKTALEFLFEGASTLLQHSQVHFLNWQLEVYSICCIKYAAVNIILQLKLCHYEF